MTKQTVKEMKLTLLIGLPIAIVVSLGLIIMSLTNNYKVAKNELETLKKTPVTASVEIISGPFNESAFLVEATQKLYNVARWSLSYDTKNKEYGIMVWIGEYTTYSWYHIKYPDLMKQLKDLDSRYLKIQN